MKDSNDSNAPSGGEVGDQSVVMLRFAAFRERLLSEIEMAIRVEPHCKSYEGSIELYCPGFFGGPWVIKVRCYVLGPTRLHEFVGKTLEECVSRAEAALDVWISDDEWVKELSGDTSV